MWSVDSKLVVAAPTTIEAHPSQRLANNGRKVEQLCLDSTLRRQGQPSKQSHGTTHSLLRRSITVGGTVITSRDAFRPLNNRRRPVHPSWPSIHSTTRLELSLPASRRRKSPKFKLSSPSSENQTQRPPGKQARIPHHQFFFPHRN